MALRSIKVDEAKKTLTVVMDLEDPRPSASGKTLVVASTRGNVRTEATVGDKAVTVGINAYVKPGV